MTGILTEVGARGFAFRASFRLDLGSEAVALQVGAPDALGSRSPVHSLTPASIEERPPNSYSGIYGLDPFPLHTDLAHHRLPPRYLMLRCCIPDDAVRTTLVDSADILDTVGASLLARGLVQPRRRRAGVRPLLRLFDPSIKLFRWDIEFIRPASNVGAEAVAAVTDALSRQEQVEIGLHKVGDMLVIDNWRMLHGRTEVPMSNRGRCIDRIYLGSLN